MVHLKDREFVKSTIYHKDMFAVTWLVKIIYIYGTYEEEQGINYVLELLNLAILDDKSKPNQYLT